MMALGMTRDEYWNGDPFLVYDYIEADAERQIRRNQEAWLQGAYICEAVGVAIAQAFSKNRNNLPKYPDSPYDLSPAYETAGEKEQREAKEAEAYMESLFAWGKALEEQEKWQQPRSKP